MKRKEYISILAMFFVVALGVFFLTQGYISAMDARMVRILGSWEGDKGDTALEPATIYIDKGTTVVWANMSQANINIIFSKGKTCKVSTTAARGFMLDDARNCYITGNSIEPGGTSSAVFARVGRYEYQIEYVDKATFAKGEVVVRTKPGALY